MCERTEMLVVFVSLFVSCLGFNLDIGSHVLHTGDQADSMFGFSVAQHMEGDIARLLVGAPELDTPQKQRGVDRAGGVMQCSPDIDNQCDYLPFDRNGNNVHPLGQQLDSKTDQWFGATVRSSGKEGGVVVACAPRYVWYTESLTRREPVGTCYVAKQGLTDFEEFSPCRTRHWGYHRQGSCQAGFDAAITKDGERMFIGAPGAFYWQGQIHSQSLSDHNDYQMTWEGPAEDDDQYLGYSVTVGDFTGLGEQDVALGVPKGLNYTGKIALYNHELTPLYNITGDQLGSYFGYALATVDFNGDGLDDIVVGAPMHTDYTDREMKFETGRVHVLMQNQVHKFTTMIQFDGTVNRGRFGLSVTAIGDINMDGFADLAVGAPYGGDDGRGAVFIYHGGLRASEDMKKPAQVIYAEEVSNSLSTFGWSLSGGLDMDRNQYPDLLIGAYLSNSAVLLKSRPIVNLFNHSLTFLTEGKTINLESSNLAGIGCRTLSGDLAHCVTLKLCLAYRGLGAPDNMEMEISYMLDDKQAVEPRLFFISNDQRKFEERIRMNKESMFCQSHEVYVKANPNDKLTPMTADVSYRLVEPNYSRSKRDLTPILNQREKAVLSDSITIQKNCGRDNVCIPDLTLTFTAPDTIVIGMNQQLEVDVRVRNDGEDAFGASVYVSVPRGLLYNKYILKDNTSVTCAPRTTESGGNTVLVCDIGNPLPHHKGVHFTVLFQQAGGDIEDSKFEFLVTANSTNAENDRTSDDNVIRKTVVVDVDVELALSGSSTPETVEYNRTDTIDYEYIRSNPDALTHETILGPEITHKYGLVNDGPSDIAKAEIVILWPTKTSNGNYLLYLLEQPETTNVKCDFVEDVNPLGLTLVQKKVFSEQLTGGSAQSIEISEESSGTIQSSGSAASESHSSSSSSGRSYSSGSGGSYSSEGSYTRESSSSGGSFSSGGSSSGGSSLRESSSSGGSFSSDGSVSGGSSLSESSSSGGSFSRGGSVNGESFRTGVIASGGSSVDESSSSGGSYSSGSSSGGSYSSDSSSSGGRASSGTYSSESSSSGRSYSSDGGSANGGSYRSEGSSADGSYIAGGSARGGGYNSEVRYSGSGGYNSGAGSGIGDGSRTGGSNSSYHYSYSSSSGDGDDDGGRSSSSLSSSKTYSSSSSSKTYHSSSSSTDGGKTYYRNSAGDTWSSDDGNSNENDLVRRRRTRQVQPDEDWEKISRNCGPTQCTRIRCVAGPLAEKDDLYIYIRSRVVVKTLEQYPYDDVSLSSRMVARVLELPHGVNTDALEIRQLDVTTPISPTKSLSEAPPIPWWVIVLATMAGVLILLIIILVLWKCGYFKRNRPQHRASIADDAQPLNPPNNGFNGKNGSGPYSSSYYPGDEAL